MSFSLPHPEKPACSDGDTDSKEHSSKCLQRRMSADTPACPSHKRNQRSKKNGEWSKQDPENRHRSGHPAKVEADFPVSCYSCRDRTNGQHCCHRCKKRA